MQEITTIAETPFLALQQRDRWQFVSRKKSKGVVAIIAITPHQELLLVEQFRIPVQAQVIELPAGLVGDGQGQESPLESAKRELLEETGYEADQFEPFGIPMPSSSGLTSEATQIFVATNLRKVSDVLGVDGENIRLHRVKLENLVSWTESMQISGTLVDPKVLAAPTILNYILHAPKL